MMFEMVHSACPSIVASTGNTCAALVEKTVFALGIVEARRIVRCDIPAAHKVPHEGQEFDACCEHRQEWLTDARVN